MSTAKYDQARARRSVFAAVRKMDSSVLVSATPPVGRRADAGAPVRQASIAYARSVIGGLLPGDSSVKRLAEKLDRLQDVAERAVTRRRVKKA